MKIDTEKLSKARKIALDSAKDILKDFGVDQNSKEYPHKLYEIQFS